MSSDAIQVTIDDPSIPLTRQGNFAGSVPSVSMDAAQSQRLASQISRLVDLSTIDIPLPPIPEGEKIAILEGVYYPASALTRQPQPLIDRFEVGLRDTSSDVRGSMIISVMIDRDGSIHSVRGVENDLGAAGRKAIDAAFVAIRLSKFDPGEIQGQPVGTRLNFVIEFRGGIAKLLPEHR